MPSTLDTYDLSKTIRWTYLCGHNDGRSSGDREEETVGLAVAIIKADLATLLRSARLKELSLMPHETACRSLNKDHVGQCDCYKAQRAAELSKDKGEDRE